MRDEAFFNATTKITPLPMSVLGLGGQASFAPVRVLRAVYGPVGRHVVVDVIPKAGALDWYVFICPTLPEGWWDLGLMIL